MFNLVIFEEANVESNGGGAGLRWQPERNFLQ